MYEPVDSKLLDELADKVASLCRPEAFPEDTEYVESIETHMAWVFLTGNRAYKLKKPTRTRYFDHTDADARRKSCQAELELNRRLAPDVYLGVVPLTKGTGGRFRVDGGKPVDWLIKMRRLPRSLTLDHLLQTDDLLPEDIDPVIRKLARFYRNADPAGFDAPDYLHRIGADIDAKRNTLLRDRYGLRSSVVDRVAAELHRWIDTNTDLLAQRASRIVDAHGDLRPEHIFLLPDNPVIIDCLEFERDLRLLDPVSELSFLALECERLGADWVKDRLFAGYLDHTDDHFPEELIPFYKTYHALVRATVTIWHIDDDVLDESPKWRRKATDYLRTARRLL